MAFSLIKTVKTKRADSAASPKLVPEKKMAAYMSNPIPDDVIKTTKILGNAVVSMVERAQLTATKLDRLEALVAQMKTVVHVSVLANTDNLRLEEGFDASKVPDARTVPGINFYNETAEVSSDPTSVKKFGTGTLGKGSTTDFQSLMGSINPEADESATMSI